MRVVLNLMSFFVALPLLISLASMAGCSSSTNDDGVSDTPGARSPQPSGEPSIGPSETPVPTSTPAPSPGSTQVPRPTSTPPTTPTPLPVRYCPEGMSSLLGPDGVLRYCVDTYEVTVAGDLGTMDQHMEGAIAPNATSASSAGVLPTAFVSYDQAVVICSTTPFYDEDGSMAGYKRMTTSSIWEDACDGLLGKGGTLYPWGNTFDDTRCATLNAQGQQVYDTWQPAGSFVACVSAFGVYDQIGNLWEWADTELIMDIDAWFALATEMGLNIQYDEEDLLFADHPKVTSYLTLELVGVQPNTIYLDYQGYLSLVNSQVDYMVDDYGRGPRGFLLQSYDNYEDPAHCSECFLPVEVVPVDLADPETPYHMKIAWEADGGPVPDKRGGAYYTVEEPSCTASQLVHFYDTHGTIGFRCMCDPLVR